MPHKRKMLTCCLITMPCDPSCLLKPEGNLHTDTDKECYETGDYNVEDVIRQPDDQQQTQEFTYTAEHIATQPNMNDHSRSIDIRIHGIRQDYLDNAMRIGGVASEDNTSDILTKNLQPHLHQKHCL